MLEPRLGPPEAPGERASEHRADPPFYDDLAATLEEAWRLLSRGASDRRSPFHTPTLATLRQDGSPTARTVVLRAADTVGRTLRFHTDIRSSKFLEIAAEPRVAVHFYDASCKIQLRIDGLASLHTGDEVSAEAWRITRPFSRACYRVVPGPGQAIEDPRAIQINPKTNDLRAGRDNFAALWLSINSLEWLYLAGHGHRRARFAWNGDKLTSNWLVP